MSVKLLGLVAAAAFACSPALAANAPAAQLGAVSGSVMISQNGKLAPANTAQLKAGDRVVAAANSSATVRFADGCTVLVQPASMITVSAKSPCATGAALAQTTAQPMEGEMFGGNGALVAVGSFAVLGGAAVAVGLNQNDGSPASP